MNKIKKSLALIIALITAMLITACGAKTCHYCDEPIEGESVEANGRSYCSYDHYMNEVFFGG